MRERERERERERGKLPVWVGCLYHFAGPDAENIKCTLITYTRTDGQTNKQRGLSVDIVIILMTFMNTVESSIFVVDQCSWISWVTLSHEFTFTPTICNINY